MSAHGAGEYSLLMEFNVALEERGVDPEDTYLVQSIVTYLSTIGESELDGGGSKKVVKVCWLSCDRARILSALD